MRRLRITRSWTNNRRWCSKWNLNHKRIGFIKGLLFTDIVVTSNTILNKAAFCSFFIVCSLKHSQWLSDFTPRCHRVTVDSHCRLVSSLCTSSLCWYFMIDSVCEWSLYSPDCQRRENMLPPKVIKSDRASLQGEQKMTLRSAEVLSLMSRFHPVCVEVSTCHNQIPVLTWNGQELYIYLL